VNDALIVLLPKNAEASNMLAPWLGEIVLVNQSAFIKGRLIQDNFKLVQLSTKMLHARRKLSVLLKIDIAQAFDSVAWPYLLELLQHMGFLSCWRDWVSALLSSASTKVLLNGVPGDRIFQARGLRQGDLLSPMLFLLVMEVCNALIQKADECRSSSCWDSKPSVTAPPFMQMTWPGSCRLTIKICN
jgi:hypothetical protein